MNDYLNTYPITAKELCDRLSDEWKRREEGEKNNQLDIILDRLNSTISVDTSIVLINLNCVPLTRQTKQALRKLGYGVYKSHYSLEVVDCRPTFWKRLFNIFGW